MTHKTALRITVAAILISLFGLMLIGQAHAAVACAPLADILARFKARYGEVPIWEGTSETHRTIIIANGDGSWTAIHVQKSGEPACVVASGSANKTDAGI